MSEKWRVKNLSYTVRHWRPCRQELSTFNSWPLSFDLWLIHDDNVHSTSHSKDNERRLRAGACFNLSSAKLRKKKLSEYEKILFDTLILYDTKKYVFSRYFFIYAEWVVSCFRHLKKQSITNKNISKQKTIKQNVLLYILLFLLVFLNGESNSESHDVSFLFVSFLLF